MPNPLAIGVTLGGLLLDFVAPRPKPRAGSLEFLSSRLGSRCEDTAVVERQSGQPVASG